MRNEVPGEGATVSAQGKLAGFIYVQFKTTELDSGPTIQEACGGDRRTQHPC